MNKAVIATLLSVLGVSFSSAQNHYYHTPSSQSMIQSLRGVPHQHSHNSQTRRSIQTSPHVQAKGCDCHIDGSLSYHVDTSCQLCTTQVQFLRNSTAFADQASYTYLQNLAYALNSPDLRNQRFVIEGHASAEGTQSVNLTLSQRRANAIFDFLVRQGVSPARLMAVGYGESQAQHSSYSPEYLRAQDRKVVVYKVAG